LQISSSINKRKQSRTRKRKKEEPFWKKSNIAYYEPVDVTPSLVIQIHTGYRSASPFCIPNSFGSGRA